MSVKQIIQAECDAMKCKYEGEKEGRSVLPNDPIYAFEDTIFHAQCFENMSPLDVTIAFRIPVQSGDFQPATGIPTNSQGLPDLTNFIQQRPASVNS